MKKQRMDLNFLRQKTQLTQQWEGVWVIPGKNYLISETEVSTQRMSQPNTGHNSPSVPTTNFKFWSCTPTSSVFQVIAFREDFQSKFLQLLLSNHLCNSYYLFDLNNLTRGPSVRPSTALQPFFGPCPLFQFLNLYIVGRTTWTGNQPVAKPLPKHRTT
jgi:hypothetical protein